MLIYERVNKIDSIKNEVVKAQSQISKISEYSEIF